jgi:hypothetical protein
MSKLLSVPKELHYMVKRIGKVRDAIMVTSGSKDLRNRCLLKAGRR